MRKRTKLQDGIFLAAGIYLIYIAYQLFKETPEAMGPRIALTIAEIVFVIVGVWITIRSVLAFIPRNQEEDADGGEKNADAESEGQKTEEVPEKTAGEIEDQAVRPDDIKAEGLEEEPGVPEEEPEEPEEEPIESEDVNDELENTKEEPGEEDKKGPKE